MGVRVREYYLSGVSHVPTSPCLCYRPLRRRMGDPRTALAACTDWWPASHVADADDYGWYLLRRPLRLPVARAPLRLPAVADEVDGLITNDRFCVTRHSSHRLTLRGRRHDGSRRQVHPGGDGETSVDGAAADCPTTGRDASMASGVPAPGAMERGGKPCG